MIAKQTNERRHMVEKNLRNARPRICRCMSEFPQGKHRTKCTAQFEQKRTEIVDSFKRVLTNISSRQKGKHQLKISFRRFTKQGDVTNRRRSEDNESYL